MDKKKQVFLTVLVDFFTDIYNSYPDNSLLLLITATKTMAYTNPDMVIENFMYCITPYITKIKSKDESFFLSGGLNDVGEQYAFIHDEISKVINIWNHKDTSIKTKNAIWKYFEVLIKLGEQIKVDN